MVVNSADVMRQRARPVLSRLPAGPCRMAEIGVAAGLMAKHLMTARVDLHWTGVDNWLPQEDQPKAYRDTGDTHAHLSLEQQRSIRSTAYAAVTRFIDRATIMDMSSMEAATLVDDESFDVVFIDADHSKAAVAADLRAWWPKVKLGGWLGGHDYLNGEQFQGVADAVHEWSADDIQLDEGTTWWRRKL